MISADSLDFAAYKWTADENIRGDNSGTNSHKVFDAERFIFSGLKI